MIKDKKNFVIILGMILVFIGTLLPSIKIAQENISFLKENGPLTIILALIMFILLKLEKRNFTSIPSVLSIGLIVKFVIDNKNRLQQIRETYNCYAEFQYGLLIILIGDILILLSVIIQNINVESIVAKIKLVIVGIRQKFVNIRERIKKNKLEKKDKPKKVLTPSLISKLAKKDKKNKIISETTKDGKIKYKKIVVKVDNKIKEKLSLKERISNFLLKLRLKKISKKRLSVSKYKETCVRTYYVPTIDIKRWTRSNISCINCGATVNTNSEYCFLCDCKISMSENKENLS